MTDNDAMVRQGLLTIRLIIGAMIGGVVLFAAIAVYLVQSRSISGTSETGDVLLFILAVMAVGLVAAAFVLRMALTAPMRRKYESEPEAEIDTRALLLAWRAHTRERVDFAARQFARFVARLRRAGVPVRAATETPAAYAVRASAALPEYAQEIGAIVDSYLAARYERDPEALHLARLRQNVSAFRPRGAHA